MTQRSLPVGLAAAGGAGLALSLANPPLDIGPLAFLALIPLLWALRRARPGRGALVGFVFGLVYYGILLYWLLPFGVIAWLPLVTREAVYAAAFGAAAPFGWRDDRPVRSALLMAGMWTSLDWIRGLWPVGGFTWGALGYTQHGNRLLLPLASITGVWGITFVVLLVNALLLSAAPLLFRRVWGRGARLIAVGAIAVLLPALVPLPAAAGPTIRVAVIQGNVPLAFASDRLLQTTQVVRSHIRLQRRLARDRPDLAVWPENSLYDDPVADRPLGEAVSAAIRAVGVPTIVGSVAEAPGRRFYNQALLYSARGRIVGRYTKIHLVPFGEYIPFQRFFGWTERYRRGNALLSSGHRIRLFQIHRALVATPICFENVFPNLFRKFVAHGANLVVLTTNDSSFLLSTASREHVIMSQLRAVENGRWIVQAAISGESAVVSPRGQVVRQTGLFQRTILRATVPTSNARTIYNRLGDWFPWACGLALVALLFARWAPRPRRRLSEDGSSVRGSTPPAGERGTPSGREPLPISGAADPRVLVVLPTYNERATVAQVLAGVVACGPRIDALVIDDNSPDGTGEVVQAMAEQEPRIRLIERGGKQGLASAYVTGFHLGLDEGYDVMIEMDSDLSHLPDELPRLLEGSARYDLTIGSRYVPGGAVTNWSRARLALSRAGNAYARIALRLPVTDATSGYRAFRRPVLEALLEGGIHADGYAFQIELAYRAWRLGFSVGEVPITFREREHGRSKLSRRIVLEALFKVGRWGLRDRFSRNGRPPGPDGVG
jgi:apolipoprotein N-acyltransferase